MEQALFLQYIEQPGQTDGDADAGKLFIRVIFRQVVIPSPGADRADLRVLGHEGFVHGAGVVVQPPGDGQVHREFLLGHPEGPQVLHHCGQLVQSLVEQLMPSPVRLQGI